VFVALEIRHRPQKGLRARLEGVFRPPKVWVEPRECCGAQYAALCAEPGKNGLDWEEIEWLAKDYSRWILLPEGVELPPGSAFRQYRGDQFDRQVLLETACALIARTRMPMYRRILGLIDQEGGWADSLYPLLKHYTAIKVVTKSLSRYRFAGEQMMEELGAPIMVGDQLSALSDCVLVLCPEDYESPESFRLRCPVLAGGRCVLRFRPDLLCGLEVALPGMDGCPPGISPHTLAGALYDLCDLRQISLTATRLLYNHKLSTLDEAVRGVLQSVELPPKAYSKEKK